MGLVQSLLIAALHPTNHTPLREIQTTQVSRVIMIILMVERESVYRLAAGWTAEESEYEPRRGLFFLLSVAFRPVLGPIQPPVRWKPAGSFAGGGVGGLSAGT
jgi:hypothetical protein